MTTKTKTTRPASTRSEMPGKYDEVAQSAKEGIQDYGNHFVAEPAKDVFGLLRDYAKDRPDVTAVWCFGLGILVGWKLRG